jgi:hypothetical protein
MRCARHRVLDAKYATEYDLSGELSGADDSYDRRELHAGIDPSWTGARCAVENQTQL